MWVIEKAFNLPSFKNWHLTFFINLVITAGIFKIFINNIRIKYTTPPEDPCDFTETCEKRQLQDAHAMFILVTLIDTIHYIDLKNKIIQKISVPLL